MNPGGGEFSVPTAWEFWVPVDTRERRSVRFGFIDVEKAAFPVRVLCRMLQAVARRPLRGAAAAAGAASHERLELEIAASLPRASAATAARAFHAELVDRGCRTSRKRVAALMRGRGLVARRRRRFCVTTRFGIRSPLLRTSGATVRTGRARSSVGHGDHLRPKGGSAGYTRR
jgi:hypothetical protein